MIAAEYFHANVATTTMYLIGSISYPLAKESIAF
jgi:hypothetical protein